MSSGTFGAIDIAATGVTADRRWLDAISDNIANVSTVRRTSEDAFQSRYIEVQANEYGSGDGGVKVVAMRESGNTEGILTYEPDNPLADEAGYVKRPDVDLGEQMSSMIMAQRGYQANLAVVDRAKEAYQAAISIGRG